MIRAITPVAALLFGTAILLTGQGLQGTLIPVRATLESFSTISIGLMGDNSRLITPDSHI